MIIYCRNTTGRRTGRTLPVALRLQSDAGSARSPNPSASAITKRLFPTTRPAGGRCPRLCRQQAPASYEQLLHAIAPPFIPVQPCKTISHVLEGFSSGCCYQLATNEAEINARVQSWAPLQSGRTRSGMKRQREALSRWCAPMRHRPSSRRDSPAFWRAFPTSWPPFAGGRQLPGARPSHFLLFSDPHLSPACFWGVPMHHLCLAASGAGSIAQ